MKNEKSLEKKKERKTKEVLRTYIINSGVSRYIFECKKKYTN